MTGQALKQTSFSSRVWVLIVTAAVAAQPYNTLGHHKYGPPQPTGKELYMAAFQGRGPALRLIPIIDNHFRLEHALSADRLSEAHVLLDRIVKQVEHDNPRFFPRFRRELRSGEHLRIQTALTTGANVTREALFAMPEFTGLEETLQQNRELLISTARRLEDLEPESLAEVDRYLQQVSGNVTNPTFARGWFLALAVYLAAAVAFPPALAIAVALAVTYAWAWFDDNPDNYWLGSPLIKEQLVHELATNLSRR